ncbi:LysE family translocator [Brevibacillus massiliensis]|uniref:LysE family translocator n=1 Tax=Brevibacillus massiliensis TaxID=1118054 RepID=UPI0002DBCC9D|nr:LysE family translocator [Brevibacillus massiliensis]
MQNVYLFVLMSIFLIILPGPDTGLVTQNTIAHGRAGGMKTILGISSGLTIHTLAAVFGLSAMIVKSAVVFSIFKYLGAVYLIYLGVTSLRSLRKEKAVSTENDRVAYSKYQTASPFRQGFLTDLLNPKVAVFFLTFLPQFLKLGSDPLWPFLIMGMTYTALTVIWLFLYVYLIDYFSRWMKQPSTQRAIQKITGLVLVAFGIKLALEHRP